MKPEFLTLFILLLCFNRSATATPSAVPAAAPAAALDNRVASIFVSQDFLNEQLKTHIKSPLIQEIQIALDPDGDQIFLRGIVKVPVEEMRAVNLDPALGAFRFQAAIKLEAT